MSKETNCKDWAMEKANDIKQICGDLKYISNRDIRNYGISKIEYLADRILEHIEYLEIKEIKEESK